MADVRAFRGVHYNKTLLTDLPAVICPPYDVISPEQQQELYSASDHNFVRLEHGRELPQDTSSDNKYSRSAATMERWLRDGVLEQDREPKIYIHDHHFTYQGKNHIRRGIIAQVRLEEWDKGIVRPHEGTLSEPRGDRLSLMWALQANTSPILSLFEDRDSKIASLIHQATDNELLISYKDFNGGHDVWAITNPEIIIKLTQCFFGKSLYIADGHHRYESALTYRREQADAGLLGSSNAPHNFVMMSLVDFTNPGLLVLPPHRLIRGIPKSTLSELHDKLNVFFEIEELPVDKPGVWNRVDDILSEATIEPPASPADVWERVDDLLSDTTEVRIALFGPEKKSITLLKLHHPDSLCNMMPYFHSALYRNLDVSIVDHVILEKFLELSREKEATSLAYSYDRLEAIDKVLHEEYQLALLINPVKPELIKAIADVGDKMPRKSTYFYPKSPSGLVFNRLV